MNKLKIGYAYFSLIVGITLFLGCTPEVTRSEDNPQYSFIEPVQIVEVNADMKSFRIVIKLIKARTIALEGWINTGPYVLLDTKETTARHNEHFINHIDGRGIGDFTPMDDVTFYRDVELIPENITEDVSIFYYLGNHINPVLINRLEVILRPKTNIN